VTTDRSAHSWLPRIGDPSGFAGWHEPDGCDCDERSEVVTGTIDVAGHRVAVILAGQREGVATLTAHVAAEVAHAFDCATRFGLAVIGVATSGGVRLQEGTPAFVTMTDVTAAVARHRDAGLLFACYLADPATGGTLASWAGSAQVRLAEPDALIAFAGPRVVELTTSGRMDVASYRAEVLQRRGVVDVVVSPDELGGEAARLVRAVVAPDDPLEVQPPVEVREPVVPPDPWDSVQRTRAADRPGLRQLLAQMTDVVELRGDGLGAGDDPTVVAALARVRGRRIALVGHDRSVGPHRAAVTAAGFRKAQRMLELAESLRLPVVSVVDTPGARLAEGSRADTVAFAISAALTARASAMAHSARLVSVLLGEGGGGAALAFVPAQRVIAAESAWLAPLPPEGSSAVLHRDVAHADEAARAQHITAADLYSGGTVHTVVAEDGDWIGAIADAVAIALDAVD
jgi:acetyl-CoA carboxylase carboxyl transferase subunit beta